MAFDSLTDKLQNVFRKLRSKGTITEADVKEAMKEVKRALLEADVNFKVVKQFINSVSERAVGEEVLKGLNPGQMVIEIVKEEMDKVQVRQQPLQSLQASLKTRVKSRCLLHVTFIVRRQSSSWRLTVKKSEFLYFRWEMDINR